MEMKRVQISEDRFWAGTGVWTGERIEDCPAVLTAGEAGYVALDAALRAGDKDVIVEVDGHVYRVILE